MRSVRFLVTGRVQGVFFRASTRQEALRLRLTGYAKNLPDGCVEVLACGDPAAIADLERWLKLGPPLARVEALSREDVTVGPVEGFATL